MRVKNSLKLSLPFAAFMLLQLLILRMCNSAGRGYLPEDIVVYVYPFLQVIVIAGFFAFILTNEIPALRRLGWVLPFPALCLCAVGGECLLFCRADSLFCLVVTGVTVFFLGIVGGSVYRRYSLDAVSGGVGIAMGLGGAAAFAVQFAVQLQWQFKPAVCALLPLSAAVIAYRLLTGARKEDLAVFTPLLSLQNRFLAGARKEDPTPRGPVDNAADRPASRGYLRAAIAALVITSALLLFTGYFNTYIHRLQIASGYDAHSAYEWPRLFIIPGLIFFGILGDFKRGRFLSAGVLCAVSLAFLNAVLVGSGDAYYLNMSLYYVALSATIAYYDLTFWRLASKTKRPSFWASAGRILDSLMVIAAFLINFSDLSSAAVLAIDVGALAVIVVLMAINGEFDLTARAPSKETPPSPAGPSPDISSSGGSSEASAPARDGDLTSSEAIFAAPAADKTEIRGNGENALETIRERYRLTPAEMNVFGQLVLTEDKQNVIGERLHIKVRTVQANVTSIYRKTGVSTRSGLVSLYHEALKEDS